jgi:hypothetical protein
MEHGSSGAVVSLSQEISNHLWNLKIQYSFHKNLSLDFILSQLNVVCTLAPYFFKIHFNVILSFMCRSPFRFLNKNLETFLISLTSYHMSFLFFAYPPNLVSSPCMHNLECLLKLMFLLVLLRSRMVWSIGHVVQVRKIWYICRILAVKLV